jgi:hypothetical protein
MRAPHSMPDDQQRPRMHRRPVNMHEEQLSARSTPRAPYHIPWPNFNFFSVHARVPISFAFLSKTTC